MKIRYIGTHQEVTIPLPFGGEATCKKNKVVEVPDSLGKQLLDQPTNFKKGRK